MRKSDRDKLDKLVKYLKERFGRYQTNYQVLGIKSSNITDKEVKDAYDNKCNQLNKMLEGCEETELKSILKNCKQDEIEEAKEIIHEAFEEIRATMQDALDDAYTALKTEDSRSHYQDILDDIEGVER